MKRITLDDAAYERLRLLKRWKGDSFSAVVKRVVPMSGTLGAILNHLETRPPSDKARDGILEASISDRPTTQHDPWI